MREETVDDRYGGREEKVSAVELFDVRSGEMSAV
jgi:hypothetical protein